MRFHRSLLLFVSFRILNALTVSTFFSPDEYWQSLEVAHKLVYGYGYLTWEWKHQIRSFIHPFIFTWPYKLLQTLNMDSPSLIYAAPKVFQGIISGIADAYSYQLAKELYGKHVADKYMLMLLTLWFQFYNSVRTFVNSFEMFLSLLGLYYWPSSHSSLSFYSWKFGLSLVSVSLACLVRPPALFFWIILGIMLTIRISRISFPRTLKLILFSALIFSLTLILSIALDSFYYGSLTISQWNFLKFNVIENISLFYGGHPWHWYISQGVPVIMASFLPFFVSGLYFNFYCNRNRKNKLVDSRKDFIYAMFFYVFIQSFVEHKEFRFLQPIVPLMVMISAYGWQQLERNNRISTAILSLVFVIQIFLGLYMSTMHQSGVVSVIRWLSAHTKPDQNILLLMGCHSTPFQSHFHRSDVLIEMITCEPPLGYHISTYTSDYRVPRGEWKTYKTETDLLYENPVRYLRQKLSKNVDYEWLVFFEEMLHRRANSTISVGEFLLETKYEKHVSFFNSHFIDDERKRGNVLVFKLLAE